ncbi:MAG: hypothetical protein L0I62_10810 [Gammaproteobacteria bacterium]|nr:hypothetical protein [Gammaproteobacteria bacterium]
MDPCLKPGRPVTVRPVRRYWPGDALAYYCPYRHKYFVHRLLGYVRAGGAWKCLIMADRARRPDILVALDAIAGAVVDSPSRSQMATPTLRIRALGRYLYWAARLAIRASRRSRGRQDAKAPL